jgi:hypothetical protein
VPGVRNRVARGVSHAPHNDAVMVRLTASDFDFALGSETIRHLESSTALYLPRDTEPAQTNPGPGAVDFIGIQTV